MPDAHSRFSASASDRWMACPGSMPMTVGAPRKSSAYSAWGTLAHDLAAKFLADGDQPAGYLGRIFTVDGHTIEVDDGMVSCILAYVEVVRDYQGDGALLVEQRVCYAEYLDTPEVEAWGTADAIIARDNELIVIDLKTGMGVEVSAERNSQMSLYALGALAACQGIAGDFTRVRMVISQPRIKKAPSEWDISVEELEAWARSTARSAASSVRVATEMYKADHASFKSTFLRPGEKQCKFCSAKAECPALRDEVATTVTEFGYAPATPDEFADMTLVPCQSPKADPTWLAACLSKVDLIEDWCKAIRAETERRLLAGESVPGYKLVQGKKGARQWESEEAAKEVLKSIRLRDDQMYDFSVKSPAQIAKLGPALDKNGAIKPIKDGDPKPVIGPRQWPRVAAIIKQSQGKPHVAPVDDPRPALEIKPVVDDFESLA